MGCSGLLVCVHTCSTECIPREVHRCSMNSTAVLKASQIHVRVGAVGLSLLTVTSPACKTAALLSVRGAGVASSGCGYVLLQQLLSVM
jgi:hypothetical protein